MDELIVLGRYADQAASSKVELKTDDPALLPHLLRGYVRCWLERELGIKRSSLNRKDRRLLAGIERRLFKRSLLAVGGIGSGKSRLLAAIIRELLLAGWSVIRFEPKISAIYEAACQAMAAGVPAERVVIASPRFRAWPGWNAFLSGLPVVQVAKQLADDLVSAAGSSGPRLEMILVSVFVLVGVHRLSPMEAARALQDEGYLQHLMSLPVPSGASGSDRLAHREACAFFAGFLGWGRGERATAIAPAVTRMSELLRVPFIVQMLCAEKNDIDLAAMWREQRVLLVHADEAMLGRQGARLIGGLTASMVLRTAMLQDGPGRQPVVLVVDEAAAAERSMSATLTRILAMARGQGVCLLIATQFLEQLSDEFGAAVVSQPAIQVFFRLGRADARAAAASLPPKPEPPPSRLVVSSERAPAGSEPPTATWWHNLEDHNGRTLMFTKEAFASRNALQWRGAAGVDAAYTIATEAGIPRLYVCDPLDEKPVELRRYVAGLPDTDFYIYGPSPASLVVRFPRPKVREDRSIKQTADGSWEQVLMGLQPQHALIRVEGMEPGVIRVVDVPDEPMGPAATAYIERSLRANGMTEEETLAMVDRRMAAIGSSAASPGPIGKRGKRTDHGESREVFDDGSIA